MDVRRVSGWVIVGFTAPVLALVVGSFALSLAQAAGRSDLWRMVLALAQTAIFGAIPFAVMLVGWRLAHRPAMEAPPPARPVPRPVEVPDADATDEVAVLAALEGTFTACPKCGYLGIHAPTLRDGVWPGGGEIGAKMVCGRCHYQGLPIEFDDADEYAAFVRELNAA